MDTTKEKPQLNRIFIINLILFNVYRNSVVKSNAAVGLNVNFVIIPTIVTFIK